MIYRDEVCVERIYDPVKNNQRLLRAYLAFFSGSGYRPTSPNANIIGYRAYEFPLLEEEYSPPYVSRSFGVALLVPPPTTVTVPNVVGLLLPQAQAALANLFLSAINLTDDTTGAPYNTVLTQSIPAGTQVAPFTQITLQVQDLTTVPQVTGLDLATAIATLVAAVLGVAVVTQIGSPVGIVISQSIDPDTLILANTVVTITVNIPGPGFRVQAVTAGWYRSTYYNPGDVFDLLTSTDFSDASQNYEFEGGEWSPGWQLQVAAQTPLSLPDGNATFPAVDPLRRFVE